MPPQLSLARMLGPDLDAKMARSRRSERWTQRSRLDIVARGRREPEALCGHHPLTRNPSPAARRRCWPRRALSKPRRSAWPRAHPSGSPRSKSQQAHRRQYRLAISRRAQTRDEGVSAINLGARSNRQSSGTGAAFISLISQRPLTRTRVSSELVCAAILFATLST